MAFSSAATTIRRQQIDQVVLTQSNDATLTVTAIDRTKNGITESQRVVLKVSGHTPDLEMTPAEASQLSTVLNAAVAVLGP